MAQAVQSRYTLLLVDDDADDLYILEMAFSNLKNDYDFVTAGNGKEALDYLLNLPAEAQNPCLIVLDLNMPIMDGRETLAKLRSIPRFANVPVAVFTTSDRPYDRNIVTALGAQFITKPVDMNQYKPIVERLLAMCSQNAA